jgi:hypothetical protein
LWFFVRKTTLETNPFFHTFVLKTHVTCIFMAVVEMSPNGARHTQPRASDPKESDALGEDEKEL